MNPWPTNEKLFDEIRTVVGTGLATGKLTIDYCAAQLGISRRTLQRRLDEHSVTFSSFVNEYRLELAKRLLGDNNLAIAEIAVRLGYSSTSNFGRAFQRSTGITPSQFRSESGIDQ